ncbi:MAG TPA: SDR family NAD(P)-dependent oxidoreductase, partial [Polyangiaceae bacterium]|nr:SDR family NAD(P)-dependent oxidoreductase [Polyangiaceae bacterium]
MKDYYSEQGLPEAEVPVCPIVRSLAGQTALVTGANSGIGKAIAVALGHAGANVVVNYVSREEETVRTLDDVRACGGRAISFRADVSKEAEVQAMFAAAKREFGTVDILVNNAGLQRDARFEDLSEADWDLVIDVNLKGQFLCSREAVREFKRRGVRRDVSVSAGKIICISSVHDVIPWAGHVNYAASKGGVAMMMRSIAQEVAPYRIRVNSISPG